MFVGDTILETWKKSLQELVNAKEIVPTERGDETYEILNTTLQISNPLKNRDELVIFDKKRGIDYYSDHYINYWTAFRAKTKTFPHSKIKQQDRVIDKLSGNEFNRHGYISIWSPTDDLLTTNYPSCIIGLYLLIRNEKLNMTAILRSNDAWGQALNDIYEITAVQIEIANKLQIDVGTYTHFAMSYHLYSKDHQDAVRLLQEEK